MLPRTPTVGRMLGTLHFACTGCALWQTGNDPEQGESCRRADSTVWGSQSIFNSGGLEDVLCVLLKKAQARFEGLIKNFARQILCLGCWTRVSRCPKDVLGERHMFKISNCHSGSHDLLVVDTNEPWPPTREKAFDTHEPAREEWSRESLQQDPLPAFLWQHVYTC